MQDAVALTALTAEILSSAAEAILATALGLLDSSSNWNGARLFTTCHVFKGHVFPDGLASFPHSATAPQLDVQPLPQ